MFQSCSRKIKSFLYMGLLMIENKGNTPKILNSKLDSILNS